MAHAFSYNPIPPEPWGRRLSRVREDVAGLTMLQVVALVGQFMLTSEATLTRLERLDSVPAGPRQGARRQLAYILCRAYNVDPAEFGLSDDDVPPGMVIPPRTPEELAAASTKW